MHPRLPYARRAAGSGLASLLNHRETTEMKNMRDFIHRLRPLLSGALLIGLVGAPDNTAAELQTPWEGQRYVVVPPSAPAPRPAGAPVQATRNRASTKGQRLADSGTVMPVSSTESRAPDGQPASLSYAEAIQMALTTSSHFKNTKLDVEIVKLGEKDSWYRLFPKLNMVASYDTPLNNPNSATGVTPYTTVSFSTGAYDPIAAYIGHDASKVATRLAELIHLQTIQSMMEQIGVMYINLSTQGKIIACRQELRELAQKGQTLAAQRAQNGSYSPLDHRLADLKGSVSQMELDLDKNQHSREMARLKGLLGIGPENKAAFRTESLAEIIGDQPTLTLPNFAEVERRNVDFKIMKLREKLQTYNVRLAQAEHLPKFSIGLRTPDPTATKETNAPYYATFSASLPLWSWGETMRNVERAELTGQKISVINTIQTNQAREAWTGISQDLHLLRERLAIATTTRELRELEAKRELIKSQVGNAPYEALLVAQTSALQAKMVEIKAQEDYAKARLRLRIQSGELLDQYVKVSNGAME